MKVQARQFEKKAENKAVVNSTREAQTFSFEELFTLKNDLLQLTYYLSVELRNSFRSTISFALNEKFIKKKKIKKFMIFMLEVNNICHNLHEMIIHLEKNKCNEIDQFSVDMLVDLLYQLVGLINIKENKEYQDMTKFFDFHYSELGGCSCFWAKKILTLISD
ncbi:MAG: hypothetical protein IKB33_00480 [Spirochaetaceae bacterium]|nr:hypothetical protein [Spirochaetaceae bacterium]